MKIDMVKHPSGVPAADPKNPGNQVVNPAVPAGALLNGFAVKPQALGLKRLHNKAINPPLTIQVQVKTILSTSNPMSTPRP
jgi:hypothetical protein